VVEERNDNELEAGEKESWNESESERERRGEGEGTRKRRRNEKEEKDCGRHATALMIFVSYFAHDVVKVFFIHMLWRAVVGSFFIHDERILGQSHCALQTTEQLDTQVTTGTFLWLALGFYQPCRHYPVPIPLSLCSRKRRDKI